MGRGRVDYNSKVIQVSVGIKRKIIKSFDLKVKELGFNRSEVVSKLIYDFLKEHNETNKS